MQFENVTLAMVLPAPGTMLYVWPLQVTAWHPLIDTDALLVEPFVMLTAVINDVKLQSATLPDNEFTDELSNIPIMPVDALNEHPAMRYCVEVPLIEIPVHVVAVDAISQNETVMPFALASDTLVWKLVKLQLSTSALAPVMANAVVVLPTPPVHVKFMLKIWLPAAEKGQKVPDASGVVMNEL
jgi:hypothetical protein